MLWSEPVLYRDDDDVDLGDEVGEVVVVELREGGFEEESTAMEVDQDGKFLVVLVSGVWEVKASGNGGVVRDDDVLGRDMGLRVVKRGWGKWGLSGAFYGAVSVDSNVGGDFCYNVVGVGCGGHLKEAENEEESSEMKESQRE